MATRLGAARWPLYYILGFGLLLFLGQLRLPIIPADHDMWYHLNAGRFIWSHHAIPREAFFSFLSPPRRGLDYYWLSQALFYACFRLFEYPGLIVLRACLYASTLAAIGAVILGGDFKRPTAAQSLLFSCYGVLLLFRFEMLRPYMFSYFFIAAFLYILERRPAWRPVLPLLGALWANLHGVYAMVGVFILSCYAARHLSGMLSRRFSREDRRSLAWLTLSAAAFFATPHGIFLFKVTYSAAVNHYLSRRVGEGYPVGLENLLTFALSGGAPVGGPSWLNVMILCSFAVLVRGIRKKDVHPTHAFLAVGALLFLPWIQRCRYDYALLSLPLLAAWVRGLPGVLSPCWAAVLLCLPLAGAWRFFLPLHAYPLLRDRLPHGTAAFLNSLHDRGSILNDPNLGGYLEWTLDPSYRIAMDMQLLHLFDADDWYFVHSALTIPRNLAMAAKRYHPEFILVSKEPPQFKPVAAAFPRYVPIFLDDQSVLYVDKQQRPALAAAYALPVDPYLPIGVGGEAPRGAPCGMPSFLTRMIDIDPHIRLAEAAAADYCDAHGDFAREAAHAGALIQDHPEEALGFYLRGRALRRMKELRGALDFFNKALSRAPEGDLRELILLGMAQAHRDLGEQDAELEVLSESEAAPPSSWPSAQAEIERGAR